MNRPEKFPRKNDSEPFWKRISYLFFSSTVTKWAVVVAVLGVSAASIITTVQSYFNVAILKELIAPAVALIATVGAFIGALLTYLGSARSSSPVDAQILERILRHNEVAVEKIKAEFHAEIRSARLDKDSSEKFVSDLKSYLYEQASGEVFDELVAKFRSVSQANDLERSARAQFDDTTSRLVAAIAELNQRANVNLVFGITMSLIGIGILGYSLAAPPHADSIFEFLKAYGPRVTLVLVVELFAYFFLNLYKASLSETRYYHNEITNIAARRTALLPSLTRDEKSIVGQVVTDLLKTERNGVLTKSQTTVELARAKMEADSSKDITSMLSRLVESLAKNGYQAGRGGE